MLGEKFKEKQLILASGSPRRQELFKELNVNFTIEVKEIDEVYPSTFKEEEITNYLAQQKAKAFENNLKENELVITSDTIVWHNNKALEKPKSKDQAIEMLQELSNATHKVITSVCLKSKYKEKIFFDTIAHTLFHRIDQAGVCIH